ncbi:LutC/YkgG family protein [Lederbergia galactosidilytica]|uniref:Lactate utilization protein C n=1 Tax=Lederbergia galactosidilytica TaxID=217031 RepID=A0A178A6X6_9BACI|nr:lactate utilization protein C [Lederbergia galactosidilytica]KRG15429.1 lactate utilization protein C [Virgibacillus soli]MBP1916208.1 L-lactate dehydrogenase complex protein LldG [Lederbergia galactosidilytica]OAK75841.1 lactate utilization protein C [Lederbergia galactosidilytica]
MSGTIQNRDHFLQKIANQLGREAILAKPEIPKWKYQPQATVLQGKSLDELVGVLKDQCLHIHTDFIKTTRLNLEKTLKEMVEEYGGGPIITWKDTRFQEYGLTSLLKEKWPQEKLEVHEWNYEKGRANIDIAETANIGITISDITLAESGTVVQFSHKDRGRSVSFLPLKSIIIIPKSSIVPRMTQAAQMIREKTKNGEHLASCINFITGPSNSADIEMDLVVGVHGPVKAAYIIVDDL